MISFQSKTAPHDAHIGVRTAISMAPPQTADRRRKSEPLLIGLRQDRCELWIGDRRRDRFLEQRTAENIELVHDRAGLVGRQKPMHQLDLFYAVRCRSAAQDGL